MANYYGQISLTKLGEFARKHPALVKTVNFRDGHTEKMINIDVRDRQAPSQYGGVAYISVYDKASNDKQYIADLKVSKYEQAVAPQPVAQQAVVPQQPLMQPKPKEQNIFKPSDLQPQSPVTDDLPF